MLLDEIKKARLLATKEKNEAAKAIFGILLSRIAEKNASGKGEVSEADIKTLIVKLDKELEEEKAAYLSAGNAERAAYVEAQKEVLVPYLPHYMSEEEIKKIIETLPDKSIKAVMSHFKEHYAGEVDMGLVSKVARGV